MGISALKPVNTGDNSARSFIQTITHGATYGNAFCKRILSTGSRYRHVCQRPVINPHVFSRHIAARFCASRSLLAELLFMLYGISELPEIINEANGRPVLAIANSPLFDRLYWQYRWCCPHHRGIVASTWNCSALSAATTPTGTSNNENLWINIQHDPDEARSQLVALRRSVLKLTGEASTQLQLLPGSGRLRTAGSQPIEAVCDAESLLVWSIAATPNIGSLKVWEYDAKEVTGAAADAQQRAREPSARLMRFTSLPMEKPYPQLTGLAGIMIQRSNHVRYLESGYVTRQPA